MSTDPITTDPRPVRHGLPGSGYEHRHLDRHAGCDTPMMAGLAALLRRTRAADPVDAGGER